MGSLSSKRFNGLALRMYRTFRGLSSEEMSAKLKLRGLSATSTAITRWEQGHRKPADPAIVRAMAAILRCSTVALYRRPLLTYRTDEDEQEEA